MPQIAIVKRSKVIFSVIVGLIMISIPIDAQVPFDAISKILVMNEDTSQIAVPLANIVEIRETASGALISTLTGHTETIVDIKWNPDNSKIATVSVDSTAKVWNTSTGDLMYTFDVTDEGEGTATSLTWSPSGEQLVVLSTYRPLNVFRIDVMTGQVVNRYEGGSGNRIAYSNNENTIVYLATSQIHLRHANSFERIDAHYTSPLMANSESADSTNFMTTVRWSPDDSRLITGSVGGSVYVWDAITLEPIEILIASPYYDETGITNPDQTWVYDVAFSEDGSRIHTVSADGTVSVWDATTFELLATEQIGSIEKAGWSQDGTTLAYLDSTSTLNTIPAPNISPTPNAGTDQTASTDVCIFSAGADGRGVGDADLTTVTGGSQAGEWE